MNKLALNIDDSNVLVNNSKKLVTNMSGNNIIYPSLTCLNDKFAVIAISSDTPNISLYNNTGDIENYFVR